MAHRRDLLVFPLAALLSAGCAAQSALQQAPAPASSERPAPAAAEPAPQRGGTLVFAGGVPNSTTHPFVGGQTDIMRVGGTVYERLLSYKTEIGKDYRADFEVVPWLAEGWEQTDPTTYRFKLRKGVTWHDGRAFTAADVLASYEWVRNPENKSLARQALAALGSVEALDDHTLRVTTASVSPPFLQDLADRNLYVVPKHLLEGGADINRTAIGTGAFRLRSHEPTRENVYARNERYWQPEMPYLDGYRVVWGLDRSASIAAFLAGQNDLLQLSDRPQFDPVLKARPETQFVVAPSDYGTALVLNLKHQSLADVRVRRALHLGLDRRAMVKSITFGDGVINPPAVPGWKQGWAIPPDELLKLPGYREDRSQDIAEAKRLLAEAGYPNGLSLRLLYQQDKTTPPPIAEAAAAQLKATGVDVVLDPRDSATYVKLELDAAFEMQVGVTHKADLRGRFRDRTHSKGNLNVVGISDPKMDQLLDTVSTTLDVPARRKAVLELQRYALDQGYILPAIEFPTYGLWQPWVKGYYAQPEVVVFFDQLNAPQLWLDAGLLPAQRRG